MHTYHVFFIQDDLCTISVSAKLRRTLSCDIVAIELIHPGLFVFSIEISQRQPTGRTYLLRNIITISALIAMQLRDRYPPSALSICAILINISDGYLRFILSVQPGFGWHTDHVGFVLFAPYLAVGDTASLVAVRLDAISEHSGV